MGFSLRRYFDGLFIEALLWWDFHSGIIVMGFSLRRYCGGIFIEALL